MAPFYDMIPAGDGVHLPTETMNASNNKLIYIDCTCGATMTIDENGSTLPLHSNRVPSLMERTELDGLRRRHS